MTERSEGVDVALDPLVGPRRDVLLKAIETLGYIEGVSDSDEACIRCARRMIAEVLGLPLAEFRLLMESNPQRPLYLLPPNAGIKPPSREAGGSA